LSSDPFTATLQAQLAANKSGTLRTLSPAQNEIVLAMSDSMIPTTDTPGAKAAKVNEFVDLILTDWATEEERKIFLEGLAETDRKSDALFGHSYAAATPKEQAAIVQIFDEELATTHNGELPKQVRSWEVTLLHPFSRKCGGSFLWAITRRRSDRIRNSKWKSYPERCTVACQRSPR